MSLQTSYDSKLTTATYDAVKAFQINSLNDSTSDTATSKIRDIEASVETFYNSVSENFKISEGDKGSIKNYVPALVYTMYDGFYIYTPYTNKIPKEMTFETGTTSDKEKGQKVYGLKPYVYYSCRYQTADGSDFVITYSLDNYITIQGKIGGKNWNVGGYLLEGVTKTAVDNYSYNNVSIASESQLKEKVLDERILPYVQINGTKYYYNKLDSEGQKVFSIISGDKHYLGSTNLENEYISKYFSNNNSATQYYKLAYEFTNLVKNNATLMNLKFSDAVNENGNRISTYYDNLDEEQKNANSYLSSGFSGNTKVFGSDFNDNSVLIEESDSSFNEHRTAVIRYAIQKNLSVAIANFNDYSGTTNEFQMPNLSETDWYSIINNISMISFLQGMPIGGKMYNGYSVVVNNKNKEVVAEDSIYLTTGNTTTNNLEYHKVNSPEFTSGTIGTVNSGEFNINFERRTFIDRDTKETKYYYPKEHLGCYNCIVNQPSATEESTDILKDLRKNTQINPYLKNKYYTALGRERYSMNRTSYEIYANNYNEGTGNWKYITDI